MRKHLLAGPDSSLRVADDPSRRDFMKGAVAAATGLMAAPLLAGQPPNELPTVAFGQHRVTRLISGGNPLYGYSHFNGLLDNLMREYFTDEQVVKYLLACEKAGINTWQIGFHPTAQQQFPKIRAAGCKM